MFLFNFINKIKTDRRFLIIIIIIVLILSFIIYRNINRDEREKFILDKVSVGQIIKEVSETGTVKASEEINLGFKTSGKIEKIYVKVGEMVKSGQNLAKLDYSDLLIKLEKARASLKVVEAKKTDTQVLLENYRQSLKDTEADAKEGLESAYQDSLNDLDDAYLKIFNCYTVADLIYRNYFTMSDQEGFKVISSRTTIKEAMDSLKPYINLAKSSSKEEDIDKAILETEEALSKIKNALTEIRNATESMSYRDKVSSADKTSLDNQKSYINTAYTNIIKARQNISATRISNEKTINAARAKIAEAENQLRDSLNGLYAAQIEEAQKEIALLENQMSDAFLRSPIGGRITKVEKKAGEVMQANEPVIVMLSAAPFQIKADIYEGEIVGIENGNPVKINLIAFPDQTLGGSVVSVDPAEKLIDGIVYYQVSIAFDETEEGMKNGMTADILIETARKENVLRVPKRAVEKINGEREVQIFNKNKIEKRQIKTGLEGNDYIEVLGGLAEGEEVVIGKKI